MRPPYNNILPESFQKHPVLNYRRAELDLYFNSLAALDLQSTTLKGRHNSRTVNPAHAQHQQHLSARHNPQNKQYITLRAAQPSARVAYV